MPNEIAIKKFHHESGKGIYSISKPVAKWAQITSVAEDMIKWLDENNGKFPEPYRTAYAVSHCQVEDDPFAFFIVSNDFILGQVERVKKDTKKNFYFPSRVIINAEILEAPEKIEARLPKREVARDDKGNIGSKIVVTKGEVKNIVFVPEACMSFSNRTQKNMERFYRIKVRYQVPRKILGINYLKTITEVVEGLKAHIFQHEVDHAHGKNMYYKNK